MLLLVSSTLVVSILVEEGDKVGDGGGELEKVEPPHSGIDGDCGREKGRVGVAGERDSMGLSQVEIE